MEQKSLIGLRSKHHNLTENMELFKQWSTTLSYWGIKHNMGESIEILSKLLTKSGNLLKRSRPQYVIGFLESATNISEEIEKYHIKNYQNILFLKALTSFRVIKTLSHDSILEDSSDILKNIKNCQSTLPKIIKSNSETISLLEKYIKNNQSRLKKSYNVLNYDKDLYHQIKNTLKNQKYRSFCRSVEVKAIKNIIKHSSNQNCDDFILAVFGSQQFIEQFFSQIHKKPVTINKTDEGPETVTLWRLTVSKNTVIYILGITTDKLLKHYEQKWFKLLSDFNSVLISLESSKQLSDTNDTALIIMLNLLHGEAIHVFDPTRNQATSYSDKHFLFQYLTHIHYGTIDTYPKISNWIIQSIFPYNDSGIKQYIEP